MADETRDHGQEQHGKASPERPYEMKGPEGNASRAMNPGPGSPGYRGPGQNMQRNQDNGRDIGARASRYVKMDEAKITDKEKVREGHRGDLGQEFQKETKPRDR